MGINQNKSSSEELLTDILFNATMETIENMAFIEIEKSTKVTGYNEHLVRLRVEILVNEPFPGEIRLVVPISLAMIFAQNMYNLDEREIRKTWSRTF